MTSSGDKRSLEYWEVESLRLTTFLPGSSHVVDPSDWWTQLVGQPPENKIEKPREGILRQEGLVDTNKLILSVMPGRADLIFGVNINTRAPDIETVPTMGILPKTLDGFLRLGSALIRLNPVMTRVAFGAVLIHPVQHRKEGYAELSRFLHSLKIDEENSEDLFYQINRPRISEAMPDLIINRLSKWSIVLVQSLMFQVTAGGIGPTVSSVSNPGFSGVRLELDISSQADRVEPIPEPSVKPVWDEIVGIGLEIAVKGDV